jgi:hypothetical protein
MMGLEPTTFCMARNEREPTGVDRRRHTAWLSESDEREGDSGRLQPPAKADSKADLAAAV